MVSIASSITSSLYSSRTTLFQKADADGDGALSLDEFQSLGAQKSKAAGPANALDNLLAANDTDSDGKLNLKELTSVIQQFLAQLQQGGLISGANLVQAQDGSTPPAAADVQDFLQKADTDGDGSLSLDELKAALPQDGSASGAADAFNTMDTDGDGKISLAELEAGIDAKSASGAGGAPQVHGGHHARGGPGGGDDDDENAVLDPLDTNGDGVVSAAERAAGGNPIQALLGRTLATLLKAQEGLAA
jgi:Ca2+-binding EF-hand superfamily protein